MDQNEALVYGAENGRRHTLAEHLWGSVMRERPVLHHPGGIL